MICNIFTTKYLKSYIKFEIKVAEDSLYFCKKFTKLKLFKQYFFILLEFYLLRN